LNENEEKEWRRVEGKNAKTTPELLNGFFRSFQKQTLARERRKKFLQQRRRH
jgi:hypothetical protein